MGKFPYIMNEKRREVMLRWAIAIAIVFGVVMGMGGSAGADQHVDYGKMMSRVGMDLLTYSELSKWYDTRYRDADLKGNRREASKYCLLWKMSRLRVAMDYMGLWLIMKGLQAEIRAEEEDLRKCRLCLGSPNVVKVLKELRQVERWSRCFLERISPLELSRKIMKEISERRCEDEGAGQR